MAYISSNKIRVFPSVGRSSYDIESQLTNENNLSQLVRSLCRNRKSYVLSNQLASNEPFEFVIYGFYFKILNATDTIKAIRNSLKIAGETTDEQINKIKIWAGIKLYKNTESNNESNSYQLLQLASGEAADGNLHELDTGKPTDNPETSIFQGVVFDRTENKVRTALKTAEGVVDGDVYVLQLLGEGTSIPAQSLLHIKSSEVLDGDTDNYINSVFTTNDLTCNNSIKSNGTLAVTGETTLNTLVTGSNVSIGGTFNVKDHTTLSTLTATNTTISGALTVIGATTLSTLTASNTQITGTLNVTDDTILASVTATFVSAPTFSGSLSGNATTATNFNSSRTFTFSGGDISGSTSSNSGNYTITASIRNGAVTNDKIANSAVTTNKINDLNITTSKIAEAAITNSKIAGKAVTNDKIADSAVTNDKIENSAVTNAKIADAAVTTNKIEDANITTSKIYNGAVTNDKIANETIKVEKLGFDLNMTLSVTGDDNEHKTLTISLPTLNNK